MRPSSAIASTIALVLVALTAALVILSFRVRAGAVELSDATDRALKTGEELSALLSEETASILGFQAKGDPRYTASFQVQRTAINARVMTLQGMTASLGPAVQVYFNELGSAIDDWHRSIDATEVTTRQLDSGEFRTVAFDSLVAMRRAQGGTNSFNEAILEFRSAERARMQRLTALFVTLAVISGPLGLSALVLLTVILRRLNAATVQLETRAHDEERVRRTEEALRQIGHRLTGGLTVDDVLRRITEGATLLTRGDVCIETIDPLRNRTMCVAGTGASVPPTGTTCAYEGSLAKAVLQAAQPRIIENVDLAGQPESTFRNLVRAGRSRSALVVPLMVESRPLGAMCLLREAPNKFTQADVPTMRIVGEMASNALQRALTVEGIQRLEDEEHFLAEAWTELASSLDYQQTVEAVARLPLQRMADWCVLHLVEGLRVYHAEVASVHSAANDPLLERLRSLHRERRDVPASVERVIKNGQPYVVRDISEDILVEYSLNEAHLRVLRDIAPASMMVVPLGVASETVGALMFLATGSRRYSDDSLRSATAFARVAARAIHNAHLYVVADRAIQSRDGVLRMVAHDLRNPLQAIGLAANVLSAGPVSAERHRTLLRSITGASRRMNTLIEDLLTIGRLRAGEPLPLDLHREDPAAIVEHVCKMMGPQAVEKSVTLRSSTWAPMPAVLFDRSRILQALTNLVDNALKFTPRGGTVTISCDRADGQMRFAVQDTGSGIDPADVDKIFEPFWQAQGASHIGVGLGLAIVKAIVEQHHGRVWVDSALGKGTTVTFALPVTDAAEGQPSKAA